jgi:hypothetical protein
MSTCVRINKQVFLVPPLGLTHMLFHDHVFVIMSMGNTNSTGSRLLRRTMVPNQCSFIGYTMRRYSLLIVLSMCNLIKWILIPWDYQEISFRKACIGYHHKSIVKGDEKGGSHICWKECLATWWLKSENCSSGIRRDILSAHLNITMSPNCLAKHFVMWITRT